MKKSNKRHILMRYLLVVLAMLGFSSMIVYSMFKTTVVYANKWNTKADSVWQDTTTIQPERGKILADNGAVLAANLYFYIARVDWSFPGIKDKDFDKALPALCDSLHAFEPEKSAQEWKTELTKAKEGKSACYRLFHRQLTHSELLRVAKFPFFNKSKKILYGEKQMRRCKPFGSMAARSIGNIREDSLSHAIHGITGLESALDSMLYGVPARAPRVQLNANTINWGDAATKGYDVTTTINVQLQDIVEEQLYNMLKLSNARWGTAVLMEVSTGEIKAISNLDWSEKSGDYIEGENHAVLGYEPGSVMKPISMMVALEDGIVKDIDSKWQTGSVWNYAGKAVKDEHGDNALSAREIIERSSNIGMSKIIVQKYGNNPDGFRQRLQGMGFFEPMHTGIAGQRTPRFLTLGHADRDRVALTRTAFGYTTEIPPMSTLAIFNAIANGGKYVCPRLVKKLTREGQPDSIVPVRYIRQQVCSPENAHKLQIMLHDVVWGSHGTARKWVQNDTVEIAGKTGTAFVLDQYGHYSNLKRLAFCGFFPYKNPKYSCIVLMYGADRGAGASSGIVLKNVALKMYARGLLGDSCDYNKGNDNAIKQPTVSAAVNSHRNAEVKHGVGLSTVTCYPDHSKGGNGVPNVIGLNVRDAVARLEKLGISVQCEGAGYVTAQSIPSGTPYKRGDRIVLHLGNHS